MSLVHRFIELRTAGHRSRRDRIVELIRKDRSGGPLAAAELQELVDLCDREGVVDGPFGALAMFIHIHDAEGEAGSDRALCAASIDAFLARVPAKWKDNLDDLLE